VAIPAIVCVGTLMRASSRAIGQVIWRDALTPLRAFAVKRFSPLYIFEINRC
jgi:hypothetical protein